MPDELPKAPVTIALRLSAETPFTETLDMDITVANSAGLSQNFWAQTPTAQITVPFHDGPGDDYRVVVQVNGYTNAGGFFHADPKVHPTVSLLMIPKPATLGFPAWAELKADHPATARLIAETVSDASAEARYAELGRDKPLALACLMNLSEAMLDIGLGAGMTPLDFIRQVLWDDTLAQDRFFGWVDPGILPLLQAAAAEGEFAQQSAADLQLHPGATLSYKQTQFTYSNVQLTFHGNDTATVGDTACIMIEPDMDLYKELVAHGLGEVIPNLLTDGKTNPLAVLALRWIDAVQSGEALFDPGYTLT